MDSKMLLLGQERSVLYRKLLRATFERKVAAYEELKSKYLKQVNAPEARLEIRRRIAEDLLEAAVGQPWPTFARYLTRLKRLGFSTPDVLVSTCHRVARAAKGSERAKMIAYKLMDRARVALQDQDLPRGYRVQEEALLRKAKEVLEA